MIWVKVGIVFAPNVENEWHTSGVSHAKMRGVQNVVARCYGKVLTITNF
jgi:hypothetical protein